MKIAIQGHPTRGKEIIQILESLGATSYDTYDTCSSPEWYWYINKNREITCDPKRSMYGYKLYTLEEFEKEFPFKVGDEVMFPVTRGWLSGKITGIKDFEYEVDTRIGGYRYVEPCQLSLYPMKEERNITLTLDKAKEWYKKGGELKEIALQAFTEKELNPLPKSWEEYCREHKSICLSTRYANISLKYDALIKLEQLRDCWWNGWKPIWGISQKWSIRLFNGVPSVGITTNIFKFLTFPTKEMAEEFLDCFRDLIEQAGDLI